MFVMELDPKKAEGRPPRMSWPEHSRGVSVSKRMVVRSSPMMPLWGREDLQGGLREGVIVRRGKEVEGKRKGEEERLPDIARPRVHLKMREIFSKKIHLNAFMLTIFQTFLSATNE